MEKARKKIRVCLLCVVALAVILGAVWYFQEMKKNTSVTEGTLVEVKDALPGTDGEKLWRTGQIQSI